MMKGRLVLITLTMCLVTSCHYSNKALDSAYGLMQERPDSALVILQQWQRDNPHPSKRNEARHALLLSMALDKNYIDLQSDSIIDKAVRYYAPRKGRERMLAYYYQGRFFLNMKSYPAAIVALEKAEKDALLIEDNLYLGLIYRNKSVIFNMTCNDPAAISCITKAISFFETAKATRYVNYAKLSLAITLTNNRSYTQSLDILEQIHTGQDDINLTDQINLCRARNLWATSFPSKEIITLYHKVPTKYYNHLDYAELALTYQALGKVDSADFWLREGYERNISDAQRATMDYQRARIEQMRGNYERAYDLMYFVTNFQDSLTRHRLTESVSSSQRDYFKKEMELETEKARTNALTLRLLIVISILTVVILVLVFIGRLRSSNAKLRESLASLHSSSESMEKLRKENVMLAGSLLSEKILFLDKLSYDYCHADTDKLKDAIFAQYKEAIHSLKDEHQIFDEIEAILNKYYDGVLQKFRAQYPQIQGEKLDMVIIFFTKIPYNAAKLFFRHQNADSLKQAKNRLRKTIQESDAPDKDLFLEMLEMKKGGRKTKQNNV